MPDPNQQPYTASAFKYVNHPNGSTLFFDVDGRLPSRAWLAGDGAIYRISIEEVRSLEDIDGVGFRTQNTAIIELFRDDFRRLLADLRQRDLRGNPIAFAFSSNAERSLVELYIDGKPIVPRVERDSVVVPKPKDKKPSPQTSTGSR